MTQTRKTLFENIQPILDKHTQKQLFLQKSWEYLANPSLTTRVFNAFETIPLADKIETRNLTKELMLLFKKTKNIVMTEDTIELTNYHERENIKLWAQKIVTIICKNLLTPQGFIDKKLLHYLSWNKHAAAFIRQDIENILCSYFSILYQQIILAQKILVNTNPELYLAIDKYINQNYRHWINKHIETHHQAHINITIEREAIRFARVLLESSNYTQLSELMGFDFLQEANKTLRRNTKITFWLEVCIRCVNHTKLFFLLWENLSSYITLEDEFLLSAYHRLQLDFCRRCLTSSIKEKIEAKESKQTINLAEQFLVHLINRDKEKITQSIIKTYESSEPELRLAGEFILLEKLLNHNPIDLYEWLNELKLSCKKTGFEQGVLLSILDYYTSTQLFSTPITDFLQTARAEDEYVLVPTDIAISPTYNKKRSFFSFFTRKAEDTTPLLNAKLSNS